MPSEFLQRPRTIAINYDSAMRYMVPSARDPRERYLVEIDAYRGNGACCCMHFATRCEPLLRRMVSPKEAVEKGLIKLKVNRHIEDGLRCEHIITARSQFVDDVIAEIEKVRGPERRREEQAC